MKTIDKLFDLTDRVALITGASSWGIGSESAKLLAEAGAKVFLVARREEALKERAAEIEAAGGVAGYLACDVSTEEGCKTAVEACVEQFGRLDIMVLSAGISGAVPMSITDDFETENWNKVLDINLNGCVWMTKYGHEECAKNGVGSIIVISSLGAYTGSGNAPYTAAKGALKSLNIRMGKQLAAENVRYNTVYPGYIDTDMTHGAFGNDDFSGFFLQQIPLQRFGTPEDVANTVFFLATDAAAWVTGSDFIVDGGQLCNH